MRYHEYQKPTVGQQSCSYSRLGQQPYSASQGQPQQGMYIVPNFVHGDPTHPSYPPRYDTLQHGGKYDCGGYFNIKGAYPYATCSECKAIYTKRPCDGQVSTGPDITTPPTTVVNPPTTLTESYCGGCNGY